MDNHLNTPPGPFQQWNEHLEKKLDQFQECTTHKSQKETEIDLRTKEEVYKPLLPTHFQEIRDSSPSSWSTLCYSPRTWTVQLTSDPSPQFSYTEIPKKLEAPKPMDTTPILLAAVAANLANQISNL